MKIQVTQENIDRGYKNSTLANPVAMALMDNGFYLTVNYGTISWDDGFKIKTPPEVKTFLKAYDKGKPVLPFSFEVNLNR